MLPKDPEAPNRGRRDPDETRREIVGAARQFLWERPFRDLTVGNLMELTSVGRSSFYVHFPDRFALAAELLREVDEELAAATAPIRADVPRPGALRGAIAQVVDVWRRHGPVIRAISDASAQDVRLEELYRWSFLQRSIDRVTEVVQLSQLDGSVPAEIDPVELATLIGLTAERYLDDRFGARPQADPAKIGDVLLTAYARILGREQS